MSAIASGRLTRLGYWSLTLVGIYVTALGPGLAGIAAHAHVPLASAGELFTALFGGGLFAAVASGRAMDRVGPRPLLVAGSLANGLGCLALAFAGNWPQTLGAGVLLGVGDSTLIVSYHVLFGELYPAATGSALSRLNVFFGIGALIGPAAAGLSIIVAGNIRYVMYGVAGGQLLAAYALVRTAQPRRVGAVTGVVMPGFRQLARHQMLWLLGGLLALYVALEAGLGSWAYTYLHAGGGFGSVSASLLTSAYWVGLTLGRALSPLALRRLSDLRLLTVVGVVTVLSAAGLVGFGNWRPGGALCIIVLGLGFGPVWPLTFAVAAQAFRHGAGAASGLLGAAGSIGGLIGPWLQGVLLLQYGVRTGLAFTLSGCLGMLLVALAVQRQLEAGFG